MNKDRNSFFTNVVRGVRQRAVSAWSNPNRKAGLTWLKIKRLKHLPYNKPDQFIFRGKPINFNNGPELLHSLQEIFVEEVYKITFEKQDPLIIDCGANIGLSVLYHKIQHPGAKIIAFEPDNTNFGLLSKNVANFSLNNVELRKEAIWKENTVLRFSSDGTLGSRVQDSKTEGHTIEVKATRLRDLLSQQVDLLKMDIEGAEYAVIKDCADQLDQVRALFIEFHGHFDKMHELTEILQLVQNSGFAYYIKEAANVYPTPFYRHGLSRQYDIQQNIFCFRIAK